MPNNYFKFKQFTILQDQCAMKVCTDACLFGAYVADEILQKEQDVRTCLDIGTGTGLLSLMIAQKNNIHIDTVEIDNNAFTQANNNINQSLFKERISIYHTDILTFNPAIKYDMIISNPPFFENDLTTTHAGKNVAKHSSTLTLKQLVDVTNNLLKDEGIFSILLPYHRIAYFEENIRKSGIYPYKKILVKQSPAHSYFRGILFFSRLKKEYLSEEITIKNNQEKYDERFIKLLKEYYLYL